MPPETVFERSKDAARQPAKVPDLSIAVLHVILDLIRKNVIHANIIDTPSVVFKQAPAFGPRVAVGHRTTSLRLGIIGDEFFEFPELPFAIGQQDPQNFPGPAVIHHDFHGASRFHKCAQLIENAAGIGCVVDDAE